MSKYTSLKLTKKKWEAALLIWKTWKYQRSYVQCNKNESKSERVFKIMSNQVNKKYSAEIIILVFFVKKIICIVYFHVRMIAKFSFKISTSYQKGYYTMHIMHLILFNTNIFWIACKCSKWFAIMCTSVIYFDWDANIFNKIL